MIKPMEQLNEATFWKVFLAQVQPDPDRPCPRESLNPRDPLLLDPYKAVLIGYSQSPLQEWLVPLDRKVLIVKILLVEEGLSLIKRQRAKQIALKLVIGIGLEYLSNGFKHPGLAIIVSIRSDG